MSATYGVTTLWDTVMSEYNNPEWFQDIVYDPFSTYFQDSNVHFELRDPDNFLGSEFGPWFQAFDERDWQMIDATYNLQSDQLDAQVAFAEETGEIAQNLDEELLSSRRDNEIEQAELQFEQTMSREDLNKQKIRYDALKTMSQLDSMIATSGISSGGIAQKKDLQMDAVEAELHQANMNKYIASREFDKRKTRAIDNYEDSLNTANLKRDVQFDTVTVTAEQKRESAHLGAIIDKLNVYDQWKANQIDTMGYVLSQSQMTPEEAQDAWMLGGDELDLLRGYYNDFMTDDWDQWKEDNPDLYADMLANPTDYGISPNMSTGPLPETSGEFQFEVILGDSGVSDVDIWAEGTEEGDEYWGTLDHEALEVAIMNKVFITEGSSTFQTDYADYGTDYNPYDLMVDAGMDFGHLDSDPESEFYGLDVDGNPINEYSFGFMLDPYNYNGIVDQYVQGMYSLQQPYLQYESVPDLPVGYSNEYYEQDYNFSNAHVSHGFNTIGEGNWFQPGNECQPGEYLQCDFWSTHSEDSPSDCRCYAVEDSSYVVHHNYAFNPTHQADYGSWTDMLFGDSEFTRDPFYTRPYTTDWYSASGVLDYSAWELV